MSPSRQTLKERKLASMNLCPLSNLKRAVTPEPHNSVSSPRIRAVGPRSECQLNGANDAFGRLSKLLGLAHGLGATLIVTALTASALGQGSVTLAWNPDAGNAIASYRLYQGAVSQTYTNVIAAGNVTNETVSSLVSGATYFFAVTAVGTNGLESAYSSEVSYTVPLPTNTPPTIALTAPVNGASYVAPATINLAASVAANGHKISQVIFYCGGGQLATVASTPYSFSWTNVVAGTYNLSAMAVYDSGNVLSTSVNVTVTNVPLPSVALTSPARGASYTAPATIPLAASVTASGYAISQVQFYNGETLLGAVVAAPYSFSWTNVTAGSYAVRAQAVYASGSTVSSAPASVTVAVAGQHGSGLTFAANTGTISAPFVASNGTISQSVTTGVTNGGQAVYTFDIVNAGNYLVSAMVIAPSLSQNSFYVNIDAEPTDPLMIWDIPVSTGLTSQTVSWRGNGNGNPASAEYIPKVFALSAGTHRLIIRGHEANTTLGTISIAATPPRLNVGRGSSGTGQLTGSVHAAQTPFILSATGEPGQTYNVLSTQDFVTWIFIGTMTLDASGSGQFTDPASTSLPSCYYRLQGQ